MTIAELLGERQTVGRRWLVAHGIADWIWPRFAAMLERRRWPERFRHMRAIMPGYMYELAAGGGWIMKKDGRVVTECLSIERMVGRLPWGMEVPLKPFFGVMAVAPPAGWGTVSTIPPRRNGGNMDNKELVAGTTLYLPICTDGARFSVGDGHAAQGDGEVCVNAIETGLAGRFRLTVRDDMALAWPMAETPTHMITMGFDPDLDDCVVIALRSMLDLIERRTNLDRSEAYMLASLTADLRITQVVNDSKGVHAMLDKKYLAGS